MLNRISLNRLQVLVLLTIIISLSITVLVTASIGTPYEEVATERTRWLISVLWVGLSTYIARKVFRSWGLVILCGVVMLLWHAAASVLLVTIPEIGDFLMSDYEWVNQITEDEAANRVLAIRAPLPLFTAANIFWALFPMLLASWPRRNNVAQPALA